MHFHTLSAILRGGWLIDKQYVHAHLPIIAGIIKGSGTGAELLTGSGDLEQPFVVKNGKRTPAYRTVFNSSQNQLEDILNEDLFEDGSTAVIPLIGPVMKYNGGCGEPGMISRSGWANDLAGSEKIVKMCFYLDTPGGQADGTPQYADLISSIDIPTLAYVSGSAYSAGAWIASACDEIVLADKYAGIGSVGVYQTYIDFSKYLKKMGVEMKDIYAKQSTEKNLDWRQAQQGDFTLIEEGVTDLAACFIDHFAENRQGKLKDMSWSKGATYQGADALSLGMADRIDSFENAITMPKKTTVPVSSPKTSHNPNSNNMKFPKLFAMANLTEVTDEALDLANGELTVNGITNVTLVRESFIQDAASLTEANGKLTKQFTEANLRATAAESAAGTAKDELATAQKDLATANSKVTELEAKVEAFGKNAGANHNAAGGDDVHAEDVDTDMDAVMDNLAHNRTADSVLGKTEPKK